jgi:hypothetical protein
MLIRSGAITKPLKAELALAVVKRTSAKRLPLTSESSIAVTVTVCGTLALNGVNVSVSGLPGPAPKSSPAETGTIRTVTGEDGIPLTTTVNVRLSPSVREMLWPASDTTSPGASLSRMVNVALVAAPGAKFVIPDAELRETLTVSPGSTTASSRTGTSISALDEPAGMVTDPGSMMKSVPGVAVPDTVYSTTTSLVATRLKVTRN